jgi:hypothetical protein
MSHFAKVQDGIVTNVIVAEQDFINTLDGTWIQCSYNTHRNTHKLGGTPLRGNYPSITFIYDNENDVFYPPQPYPSWTLDTDIWDWVPPTPEPEYQPNGWSWDEATTSWVKVS